MPNDSWAPVYKLVVSKGYVQLVREGRRQPRSTGLRFTRRYGGWVLRKDLPPATALAIRHRGDGVTAFGLGPEQAARILRWSEKAAASRQATGRLRRYHDLTADEVLEVLRTLNP